VTDLLLAAGTVLYSLICGQVLDMSISHVSCAVRGVLFVLCFVFLRDMLLCTVLRSVMPS
jgi:hypothetical protein